MSASLNWGILATGGIAKKFADGVTGSPRARVVAVGSRTRAAAEKFVAAYPGVRAHGSYEALLADPAVQAVYIATPHPGHAEWAERAARAGKHILCEKPLAINRAEAERMVAAARGQGVVLMEAFMYRCHPQTARLAALIRSGVIGELRAMHSHFTVKFDFDPQHRIFNKSLGGGGILDLGCYPVSWVRRMAGAALGRTFADPVAVKGGGRLHAVTGADEFAAATLVFPGDITAQVTCGTTVPYEVSARLVGTQGTLVVEHPFHPGRAGAVARLTLHRPGVEARTEVLPPDECTLFARQAHAVAEAAAQGKVETEAMSLDDTLGNMAALDAWRAEVGLRYAGE
jgi:predicted dehydrogenase